MSITNYDATVLKKHNGEYRIIYDSLKNLLNQ